METIIITLLGINMYLLIDYILDNYYFNGTRTKGVLILNRHFSYEIIQMLLIVGLIFVQLYALKDLAIIGWIFSIGFVALWATRIKETYKNHNCEIQIGKEKVVFIDNEGKENTIELPNYFSIQKQEGDRFSLSSKSMDYILCIKNKKGEQLIINLSGSSLGSYVTQIHKTALRNVGNKGYQGIKPWKWFDLKKLSISLLILISLFVFKIVTNK
jgi:hypothetical protein